MKIYSKKNADYLHKTRAILENINKNPAIVAELEKFSFDATRIQQGADLQSQARIAFRLLVKKRQSRKALTKDLKAQLKLVYEEHLQHITRLRKELFQAPGLQEDLGLVGKRRTDISGFIEQATHFYDKTINDAAIAAAILPFAFTPELLTASDTRFQQYQTDRISYQKSVGELQKLMVEKEKAFRSLRIWMSTLYAACRVAFADNLQTLEEIGFFVRNNPKPKKTVATPVPPEPTGQEPPVPAEEQAA